MDGKEELDGFSKLFGYNAGGIQPSKEAADAALNVMKEFKTPFGDFEGVSMNAPEVLNRLRHTEAERVEDAAAVLRAFVAPFGERDKQATKILESLGADVTFGESQFDRDRMVGSVEIAGQKIDISDPPDAADASDDDDDFPEEDDD